MSRTRKDKRPKYFTGKKAVKQEAKEHRGKLKKLTEKVPKCIIKRMGADIWDIV